VLLTAGILAIVFVVGVAILEGRDTFNPENLKRMRRSGRASLPQKLVYKALVRPGVVSLTNDGFLAAFEISAPDDSALDDEQIVAAANRFARGIKGCPTVTLFFREAQLPATGYLTPASYPHAVHRLIDERRKRFFNRVGTNYVSKRFMSVTWIPNQDRIEKLRKAVAGGVEAAAEPYDAMLDEFEAVLVRVQSKFRSSFKMRRLTEFDDVDADGVARRRSDLLRYLRFAVTGIDKPMNVPRIDGMYVKCLVVKSFPEELYPSVLQGLAQKRVAHQFVQRMQLLSDADATLRLKGVFGDWDAQANRSGNLGDLDAEEMRDETRFAKRDSSRGRVRWGLVTTTIVLRHRDRDRVHAAARELEEYLLDRGFPTVTPRQGAEHALFGSFDGDLHHNARKFMLTNLNVSRMFPFHAAAAGRERNGAPTLPPDTMPLYYALNVGGDDVDGAGRYMGHLHVGDLLFGIGIGIAGTGKSTSLGFLAHSFASRLPNSGVTLFDKGGNLRGLCEFVDGLYLDPLSDASSGIGFFDAIEDREVFLDKIRELETMLVAAGVAVDGDRRQTLIRALQLMRDEFPAASRTMSIFVEHLQDPLDAMRPVFRSWTRTGGVVGNLIDSQNTLFQRSRFVVIEIGKVLKLPPAFAIPLLRILFNAQMRQIRQLKKTQTSTKLHWLFLLDEAWVLLQHPVGREVIREMEKTARKEEIGLYLFTHSVGDITDTDIREDVLRMSQQRYFFADDKALSIEQRRRYEELQLPAVGVERLAQMQKKRHVLLDQSAGDDPESQPAQTVVLDWAFDEPTLEIIAPRDVAPILAAKERYGPAWRERYLEERAELLDREPGMRAAAQSLRDAAHELSRLRGAADDHLSLAS
jgi:type IV secretion system protein VirB4